LKNRVFSKYRDDGITDHFNLLRLQILQKLEEIGGNSLLITSANPGEGKTFTAINLGICLAQELNRTVLLVDADLRNPTSRHYDFANDFFTIKTDQGLADYLLGQAEITRILLNPGIDKLTILPAGRPLPNSAELLGSLRMATLVDEMKKRYPGDRIIIFDTPSLLCADPVVLSRYVDAVLLVVEQEKTTARDFQRATELLKNSKILGTVLNKSKSGKTAYV
jgi:non-specific protein-tyrosine kinase